MKLTVPIMRVEDTGIRQKRPETSPRIVWWSADTAEVSEVPGRVSLIASNLRSNGDLQLRFEPKNTSNSHRIGEIQPREEVQFS